MLEKKNPRDMYRSTQPALLGHSQQPAWVGENGAQFPRSGLEPHPLRGPPYQLLSPPFPTSTDPPPPSLPLRFWGICMRLGEHPPSEKFQRLRRGVMEPRPSPE